jgi:predicted alpha/beta hydrolase
MSWYNHIGGSPRMDVKYHSDWNRFCRMFKEESKDIVKGYRELLSLLRSVLEKLP